MAFPNQSSTVLRSTHLDFQYAFVQSFHIPCPSSDSSIQPLSSDFSPFPESIAWSDAHHATFRSSIFDPSDTLHSLSPLLINTSHLIESPAPSIVHVQSPSSQSVICSPPSETDEIICQDAFPNSFPATHRNDRRDGKPFTNGTDNDSVGISLHERFADVMNMVRRLPSGELPKNVLFTPFFTRNGDLYVCRLCPTKTAKTIANRTQIIQHIIGQHGEGRPFPCPSWYVVYLTSSIFYLIPN